MRRSFGVLVCLLVLSSFLSPALAADSIKIGAVFSVTGPASFLGQPERDTLLMAAERLNKAGGVLGRQVEIIAYDDETDVNKCVLAVDKLVRKDGVQVVLGPSTSGNSLAVMPKFGRYQVPLISCSASEKIVKPVQPWVFKVAPSDRFAAGSILDHIKNAGGVKVAILTVSDGFGQSGREMLKELIPGRGLELMADEVFGAKDTDMTAQLTKIKGLGPDAIVCWGTNPGPAVVARNHKQLGIDIPLYMSHGVASKKFIELAGDAAEGLFLPAGRLLVAELVAPDHVQKKVLMEYKSLYESTTGQAVSTFGGHGWDAFHLYIAAVEQAQSSEPKAVRDALEKIQGYVGTYGVVNMSPQDHEGMNESAFVMLKIHDGDWTIVE